MTTLRDYEVVTTASGARAMRDRISGEIMHPLVGPAVEAQQLYIGPSRLRERLRAPLAEPLVVLDVGLGAGSNAIGALSTRAALGASARRLEVVSFDLTRAPFELAQRPEHAAAFGFEGELAQAAQRVLSAGVYAGEGVVWRFVPGDIAETLARQPAQSADVVFWDPFSPRSSPALWGVRIFCALRRLCRAGATVHTYSGATATRAALLLSGFAVGLGPGSGTKQRHTTSAAVCLDDLREPLSCDWLSTLRAAHSSTLRSRAEPRASTLPIDAPADALERLARLPQLACKP